VPVLGFQGRHRDSEIEMREYLKNVSDLRTHDIDFTVNEFGVSAGLRAETNISPEMTFYFGANGTAVVRRTKLDIDDCINDDATSFSSSCNRETSGADVSLSDTNISPILGALVGLRWLTDFGKLHASAGASVDFEYPNYQNPLGAESRSTFIDYDPRITYFGSLGLTIPF
jgi:hypothetical protein